MRINTTHTKVNNECRRIRTWLFTAMGSRSGPDTNWLQNHVAKCLRCLRRFVSRGKVNLALSFMKTQPHRLDLLMRANAQAIGVQKHSLRQNPKARQLRTMLPEPKLLERCGKYGYFAANFAVCITIVLIMMIGVLSFMDKFHSMTQKVNERPHAGQVDQEPADEIFPLSDTRTEHVF